MASKLFVGGLAWATTDEGLKRHFGQVGEVASALVVTDKFSGKSRGFGFVEMSTDEGTAGAMTKLNGTELDGRKIIVSEARPRQEDGSRGGGDWKRGGGSWRGGRRRDFR